VRNEGIRGRMPTLLSFAVEGRAPGFRATRDAILGAENGPSMSPHEFPHEFAFSPLSQRKVDGW
jgi:hypothetical protein